MMIREYRYVIAVILLVILTSTTTAENEEGKVRKKRNIICFLGLTGFIPELFHQSFNGIHKYDPLQLGATPDGKLQNGTFIGLSTLRNESAINVYCEDENVILNTTLGMSNTEIHYKWSRKFFLTLSGEIWTKAKDIQLDLEVTLSMQDGIKLDVTKVLLTKLGGLKFGFSGLGPLNPIIKVLGNAIMRMWSEQITGKIEKLLKDALESELRKLSISF